MRGHDGVKPRKELFRPLFSQLTDREVFGNGDIKIEDFAGLYFKRLTNGNEVTYRHIITLSNNTMHLTIAKTSTILDIFQRDISSLGSLP